MLNVNEDHEKIMNTDDQAGNDLPDSDKDIEEMKSETVIMDLPEVKDIPGQEHVQVLPMGELADTTISSDDEEGAAITGFDGEDDDDITSDTSLNVSREEKELLDEAGTAIPDDVQLKQARVDGEDEEGELLNE